MEIKLKTAKGPKATYGSSSASQQALGSKLMIDNIKPKAELGKTSSVDHGLDEKNLLSVFSTLFQQLLTSEDNLVEVPQVSLLCNIFSLLEQKYLPHVVVILKSQVGKPLTEATTCHSR